MTALELGHCTSRPDVRLVAASTHSREEIERAAQLQLDFVVLGAVKPTLTHPGGIALGWERFANIIDATPLPVFALGGLTSGDLINAMAHGAHGIAMQRDFAA